MSHSMRKRLTLGLFGLALAVVPFAGRASAQVNGDTAGTGSATSLPTTTTRTTQDDKGFDAGWLGLLGLAGLAGLMPRKNHAVTTHRTGDTPIR